MQKSIIILTGTLALWTVTVTTTHATTPWTWSPFADDANSWAKTFADCAESDNPIIALSACQVLMDKGGSIVARNRISRLSKAP